VRYEIKTRVRDYAASARILQSLKESYTKASQSLKAQEHDYANGLVTNIDVIQAMTDAETAKQSLDTAVIEEIKDMILLDISLEILK
jgi:outer membrane protein TolC